MRKLLLLFLVLWPTVTVADELTRFTDERDLPAVVNPCESDQWIDHGKNEDGTAPYSLMSFSGSAGSPDGDFSLMKPCPLDHGNQIGTRKEPANKGPGLEDEFDRYLLKY